MQSTKLAKAVYWLSGKVSKIKTYRMTYRLANEDEWLAAEGDMEMMFQPAGRMWSSIKLTWTLLTWSERLDREHWEHWALKHTGRCAARPCDNCKGTVCSLEDED